MRRYELMYIISPEIADGDVQAVVERVNQTITDHDGQILDVDLWGRRKLAYPIQKFLEGSYVLTQLELEPQHTGGLEASFKFAEDILRHLLIYKEG